MKRFQILFTMCNIDNAISGFIDMENLEKENCLILMFQKISNSHGTCLVTDFLRTTLLDACSAGFPSRIRREKLEFWKQMYPIKHINLVHSSQKCVSVEFTQNSFTNYDEYLGYRKIQDCLYDTKEVFDFTASDIGISNLFEMFQDGTPKDLIQQLPEIYHNSKYLDLTQ